MVSRRECTAGIIAGSVAYALGVRGHAEAATSQLRIGLSSLGNEAVDPHLSTAFGRIYLTSLYDQLVGATPDAIPSGALGLAEKWQTSADGKQWTFHLRGGVLFHNGAPVTAEDVKFSIERAIGPASLISQKVDVGNAIASIDAPDPRTVHINLKRPFPALLSFVGAAGDTTGGMIIPKAYFTQVGTSGFSTHPIGSGPYKFVRQVGGSSIEMAANGAHFRTGVPRFASLTWRLVPEETTRVALLQRAGLEIIDLSRASLPVVKRNADLALVYKRGDLTLALYFGQQYLGGIFSDIRMRKALSLAINRPELLQAIFGGGGRLSGVPGMSSLAAQSIGLDTLAYVPKFDPDQARKLVQEAGHEGLSFDVYALPWAGVPEGSEMMQAIAGYWTAIGLRPNILPVDFGAFRMNWRDRNVKDTVFYIGASSVDWLGQIGYNSVFFRSTSTNTRTVDDPQLDRLFAQIDSEAADPQQMKATLKTLMLRIIDQYYAAPLFELDTPLAYRKAVVKPWNVGGLPNDLNISAVYSSM